MIGGLAWTLWALGGGAFAQPAPADPPPPTLAPASGEAEPPSIPLERRVRWVAVGPETRERFVDVAIHPLRANIWVAATAGGGVWVTADSGRSWVETLKPLSRPGLALSDDERVLLDVSARVQEIVDDLGGGDGFDPSSIDEGDEDALEELEQAAAEATAATDDVVFGVQTEVAAGQWLDDLPTVAGVQRPRVRFTAGGALLVARTDGIHVSSDVGNSWRATLTEAVADVAEVGPSEVLAVGPEAAWISRDLRTWTQVQLPMYPHPVDLVVDGGTFASGPAGLWFATGGSWQQLPASLGTPPATVRPTSSAYERALVVSTGRDLLRSASVVASAEPVVGGPIPEVLDLERLSEGTLLAASSEGPFVSEDDGRTWARLERGLRAPQVDAVAVAGPVVVLVGASGVYRMQPLATPIDEPQARGPAVPTYLPLGALIESASSRRELRQRIGRRIVAAAIPQVTTEFLTRRTVGPDWANDDPAGTELDLDGYWQIRSVLQWTPGRTRTAASFDAEGADEVPVMVVGREVVVDDGEAPQVLFSKVSRGGTSYRSVLAGRITEMYRVRARLLLEGEPVDPLRAVLRELRIQELDATLDLLTQGAVTQWRLDGSNPP